MTIPVAVFGDRIHEPDESFRLLLRNARNATLLVAERRGTIVNNDPLPSLSLANVSLDEGDSGGTFQPQTTLDIAMPQGVALSGLDGDGDLDLVTADGIEIQLGAGTATSVTSALNNGDGTFRNQYLCRF